MRRAALLLNVHRKTIASKLRFLAQLAREEMTTFRMNLAALPGFQFDELETFEHTKYKPLSVALAVTRDQRKILGFEVASMPAKGLLAHKAIKKYGTRSDGRRKALSSLFKTLQPHVAKRPLLESDQCPRYPGLVTKYFPMAQHVTVPGGRGCVVGQGELKALRFDPLFSLNHTFAMLRANMNRLVRRTWCTTKKAEGLADHLAIYADFHNSVLT